MARKWTYQYHMDLDSKAHQGAPAMMGCAFFLRAAYYFGFTRPEDAGVWNLLIFLILPMLIEAAFMVMIRGIRLDLPSIYGILGAAYCLLMVLQSFQSDSVLRIILGPIAYLSCAAALIGVGWNLLSKSLTVAVLLVVFTVRLLGFDLGYLFSLRLIPFIREAAGLCGILGLSLLAMGLKDKRRK